ncbi:hypothetical protein GQ55_1G244100 [Panicum hallii var. hallii]|uniref:Uncharacterized protein n=1 Tax=Panicum hallii var. hallii TaxID=1504633 RepID=A0A2T7F722_9POAL|nr:hypothetical protein GQ55_1G244100 [Panicum hallii var. hallii]
MATRREKWRRQRLLGPPIDPPRRRPEEAAWAAATGCSGAALLKQRPPVAGERPRLVARRSGPVEVGSGMRWPKQPPSVTSTMTLATFFF